MSADKQLKAYIDRVLRLKEEQDTLGDDIREVYAEAKSEGYDKTIMGKLVAHLRKIAKSGEDAVSEQEMNFDTYLQAYHRASGTAVATHTHEEQYDPNTGEILDGSVDAKLVQTIAAGVQTETGRKALIAAVDIMIEREDAQERRSDGGLDIITKHTEIATNEGGAKPDSVDMAQGSVPDLEPSGPDVNGQPNSPEEATKFLTKAEEGAEAKGTATVDPVSRAEAETDRQRSSEAGPTDGRRQGGVEPSAAAVAPAPSFLTKPPSPLRPNCQRPENCGGYGRTHCGTCLRANEREFA
ncbi:hypothetical protein ASD00_18350 [Ensifer sp. Root31]|uniref:DUF2312 domain-containing protein n=1 Tax=Ensifer sp. Root31 TaxID=1736512 RepID=UPI0007111643|nr:DUF2312 domain-containing protein [Ensifer sp. Root31]KQU96808.1 hypothetical protein ASD00_18350 [Ensifer sp. Root31]